MRSGQRGGHGSNKVCMCKIGTHRIASECHGWTLHCQKRPRQFWGLGVTQRNRARAVELRGWHGDWKLRESVEESIFAMAKAGLDRVFIDESGNTGSDLLNLQQPIFVLAALGIDASIEPRLVSKIVELERKYQMSEERELKGASLLRGRKRTLVDEILKAIFDAEGVLFLEIVEKRFNVCTNLTDDLFDPEYNDACDNSWTHFRPEKPELAELFYENLSEKTVRAAARFFRTGEGLVDVFAGIRRDLAPVKASIPVLDLLAGADGHLQKLSEVVASVAAKNKEIEVDKGVVHSPNYFCFLDLMNKIEFLYRQRRRQAELIFDSAPQFDRSFAIAFERMKNARRAVIVEKRGVPLILGYSAVRKFSAASSASTPLLRCCDLVASGIALSLTQAATSSRSLDEVGVRLATLPVMLKMQTADRFCSWVISQRMLSRIASSCRRSLRGRET